MTDEPGDDARAAREAAEWAARLNERNVDTDTLERFAAWRRTAANASAYRRVDAAWTRAEALGTDREIALITHEALARRGSQRHGILAQLQRYPVTAVFVALVALCAIALLVIDRPTTYATAVGEQRLVRLADGSRVRLNTNSRLDVHLASGRRGITLVRGEAFFEVAHDPDRPFIVATDNGRVEAIGTRFDVDRRDATTRVLLAEGRVRVYDGRDHEAPSALLKPGEAIWLGRTPAARPEAIDLDVATSWLTGQLVFHQTPLATAITEVNRYTARTISLDAPGLGTARVEGRFETGDTEAFIGAVTTLFPLRAVTGADGHTSLTSTS